MFIGQLLFDIPYFHINTDHSYRKVWEATLNFHIIKKKKEIEDKAYNYRTETHIEKSNVFTTFSINI